MTVQIQTKTQAWEAQSLSRRPLDERVFKSIKERQVIPPTVPIPSNSQTKEEIRRNLKNTIQGILETAQNSPPEQRVSMIRKKLADIQNYCSAIGKTFIVVEENIGCHQYNLNGSNRDRATLFRGPDERATVAICVTHKGSLLHRNDSDWVVYRDGGDVLSNAIAS